jgi:hypothetical protein
MAEPSPTFLEDAAIDCGSTTFDGASTLATHVKRVANRVAKEFCRLLGVEVRGTDATVSFTLPAA